MSLDNAQQTHQLHIGIFGKRNSGKSTLINVLTGHNTARVSEVAGTTIDPAYKKIEITGIGPCILIDTMGFDDIGYVEQLREAKTKKALEKTDIALIVCSDENLTQELVWAKDFMTRKIPVIMVINKIDQISNTDKIRKKIFDALKQEPIKISAISRMGIETIKEELIRNIPEDFEAKRVVGDLVGAGDTVLLVMQVEPSQPWDHLGILQIQILRVLLDKQSIVISTTLGKMEEALASLTKPPKLIIADHQMLQSVIEKRPEGSAITSY